MIKTFIFVILLLVGDQNFDHNLILGDQSITAITSEDWSEAARKDLRSFLRIKINKT